MNGKRFLKTIINLLLAIVLLAGVWSGMRKPLPWKWEYRRMERAMLLEPMEILYHGDEGEVLSVDENNLALYTGDWFGSPMWNNMLYLFPLENGYGRAIRKSAFFELEVWAYDASMQSVQATMTLTIWDQDHTSHTMWSTAQRKEGWYALSVDENRFQAEWMNRALKAMIAAETNTRVGFSNINTYESGYEMVLTFYDEAGRVTGTHESEGTYFYED